MGPISAPTQGKFDDNTLRTQLQTDNSFLSNPGILLLTSLYNGTTSSNRCRLRFKDEQNAQKNAQQIAAWLQKNGSNYSMKFESIAKEGSAYYVYVQMNPQIWQQKHDALNSAPAQPKTRLPSQPISLAPQPARPSTTSVSSESAPAGAKWKGYLRSIVMRAPAAPELREGETAAVPQLAEHPSEDLLAPKEIPSARSAQYALWSSSSAQLEYAEKFRAPKSTEESCTHHAAVSLVEFAKQSGYVDSSFQTTGASTDSLIEKLNSISNPAFWQLVGGMKISSSASMEVFISGSSSKAQVDAFKTAFKNNLNTALERYQIDVRAFIGVLNKCHFVYHPSAAQGESFVLKNEDGTKGGVELTLNGKSVRVGGMEISLEDARAYEAGNKDAKKALEQRALGAAPQMLNSFLSALAAQDGGMDNITYLAGKNIITQEEGGTFALIDATRLNTWLSRSRGGKIAQDTDAERQFRDENNPNDPRVRALYTMRGIEHEQNLPISLSLELSKFVMRDGQLQPIGTDAQLQKGNKVYVLLDAKRIAGNSSFDDPSLKIIASCVENSPKMSRIKTISSADEQDMQDVHFETIEGKRYIAFNVKEDGTGFAVSAYASAYGIETGTALVGIAAAFSSEAQVQQPDTGKKRIPRPRSLVLPPSPMKSETVTRTIITEEQKPSLPPFSDVASQLESYVPDGMDKEATARKIYDAFADFDHPGRSREILELIKEWMSNNPPGGGVTPPDLRASAANIPGRQVIGVKPPVPNPDLRSSVANIPGRIVIGQKPPPINDAPAPLPIPITGPNPKPSPPISQTANIPGRAVIGTKPAPPIDDARHPIDIPITGPGTKPGKGGDPGGAGRNDLSASTVANPSNRGGITTKRPVEEIKDGTTPVFPGPITPIDLLNSLPEGWTQDLRDQSPNGLQRMMDILEADGPGWQERFRNCFKEGSMMWNSLAYTPGRPGSKVTVESELLVKTLREQIATPGISFTYIPGEVDFKKLKPGQIVSVGINYIYNAGTRTATFVTDEVSKEKLAYGTIGGSLVLKGPWETLLDFEATGLPDRGIASAGVNRGIKLSENVAMALGGSVSLQSESIDALKHSQLKDLGSSMHVNFYHRTSENLSLGMGASRTNPLISKPTLGAVFLNPSLEYKANSGAFKGYTFGVRGNVPISGGTSGAGISASMSTHLIPLGENIGHAIISLFGGYSDMTKTFPQARKPINDNAELPTRY
ncbi:Uncharacterised protein [Candidatus Anstonella stagnisolia]|nr:Uncharacterised protein [Candidatus Anstonella stagnisolia]